MNRPRFGTDGVRGVANGELTAEFVLALGRAAARVLPAQTFLIGRDTRRSGPLLQAALAAGLTTEGADVVDLGVLPTPGVALLSARRAMPAAVVSASHNPFIDNGIKLLSSLGTKLMTDVESAIETELDAIFEDPERPPRRPTGHGVGTLSEDFGAAEEYRAYLSGILDDGHLDGLTVVLDCANGAASAIAPPVFESLGAKVVAINAEPDGTNINDHCGSTDPESLMAKVLETGASLGLAFDGDADRLVAVDDQGTVVDGDALLALFALDLAERGRLAGNTVVVTVMTNLGFRLAMNERGISVRETPVGDRNVLAAMDADGLSLGGEQSGHIVFRQRATTGDGILTGLSLAEVLARDGRPLSELWTGLMTHVPQVLVNVSVNYPQGINDAADVWELVRAVEEELGDSGRVLLRPSGTEPLVRVLVEAADEAQAHEAAKRLSLAVERSGALSAAPSSSESPLGQ